MTRVFCCTWCGAEKPARGSACSASCDRPRGWRPGAPYADGTSGSVARRVVLTEAGTRQSGYVWTDDRGWVLEEVPDATRR